MRIAAGIEYDGSRFYGWQRQRERRTVQGCLEHALTQVANHPVRLVGAGRTDSGVHATGQVVHFETHAIRPSHAWMLGANAHLAADAVVTWAQGVGDTFHARFAACSRRYRYVIFNRRARPAVLASRVSWDYRPLDAGRMAQAANALLGTQDFSSFRALACQAKSPLRTVYDIGVGRRGPCIYIDVHADGFLHHMVRNIAGVLMAIGADQRPIEWAAELLALRDRARGGVTAPPTGLYLVHVAYDPVYDLPNTAYWPWFS